MIPLGNADLWEAANEFAAAQKRQWSGEMSAEALDAWQATNLQQTIEYCQDKSPFYQRHLAGLEATSPIDALPFTVKDDLRQHLDDVASLSLDHAWVYYETTGTTGVLSRTHARTFTMIVLGCGLLGLGLAGWALAYSFPVFWILGAIVVGCGSAAVFPSVTSALLAVAHDRASRSPTAGAIVLTRQWGRRPRCTARRR